MASTWQVNLGNQLALKIPLLCPSSLSLPVSPFHKHWLMVFSTWSMQPQFPMNIVKKTFWSSRAAASRPIFFNTSIRSSSYFVPNWNLGSAKATRKFLNWENVTNMSESGTDPLFLPVWRYINSMVAGECVVRAREAIRNMHDLSHRLQIGLSVSTGVEKNFSILFYKWLCQWSIEIYWVFCVRDELGQSLINNTANDAMGGPFHPTTNNFTFKTSLLDKVIINIVVTFNEL